MEQLMYSLLDDSSSEEDWLNEEPGNTYAPYQEHVDLSVLRNELRKRDDDMNQRLDSTQQLIKTLTEELIHLKNELRQNTCIKTEQDLLPTLPLTTLEDYMQFEKNIAENEDMRKQLESLIGRVGGKNMASFIKMSIKSIITDEVAIDITWRGTPNKPSFQKFYLYNIIKEACHAQDPTSSDYVINKIYQQHILHARDRVAKRNSKAILPD